MLYRAADEGRPCRSCTIASLLAPGASHYLVAIIVVHVDDYSFQNFSR